jgi:hypothetical protein
LEKEGGLANAGFAPEQNNTTWNEPASQNAVQFGIARGMTLFSVAVHLGKRHRFGAL